MENKINMCVCINFNRNISLSDLENTISLVRTSINEILLKNGETKRKDIKKSIEVTGVQNGSIELFITIYSTVVSTISFAMAIVSSIKKRQKKKKYKGIDCKNLKTDEVNNMFLDIFLDN